MLRKICMLMMCTVLLLCVAGCDNPGGISDSENGDYSAKTSAKTSATPDEQAGSVEDVDDEVKEESEDSFQEVDIFETMSTEEKREMNIFLSNFSEAQYGLGGYDNAEDMISFAYVHNCVNNSAFKTEIIGDNYGISAELVDSTLQKYFGKTVLHETPATAEVWSYEDGYFIMPAADGESRAYFSTATSVLQKKDDYYEVGFDVYFNANDAHGDIDPAWYNFASDEASLYFEFCYSGVAQIKSVDGRYILVAYDVN